MTTAPDDPTAVHAPERPLPYPLPYVGGDVHYVSRGSADGVYPAVCRTAKITEVGDNDRVGLAVLNPDGAYFYPLSKDGGAAYFDSNTLPDGVVFEPGPGNLPGPPSTWHWQVRCLS